MGPGRPVSIKGERASAAETEMSPRRRPGVRRFPFQVAEIKKPQYLRDFREAAYRLYIRQEIAKKYPHFNPEAAYRRAFGQTVLSIFTTEATEMEALRGEFHNVFPVLKLPFKDIDAAEVEHEYLTAVEAYAMFNAGLPNSMSPAQLKRAQLYMIINEFKMSYQPNTESAYRDGLWDDVAKALLVKRNTVYEKELPLSKLQSHYYEYKTDFSIRVRTADTNPMLRIPLLLSEVGRYPLHHELSHKDETKLQSAMSAALLESINKCSHLGEPFVKKLRIYGLLIGATGFEVSVMYPDFGSAAPKRQPNERITTFAMVYRSSRSNWRFSLLDTDIQGTPRTPDLNNEAFNCDWEGAERHIIYPAERSVSYNFGRAAARSFGRPTIRGTGNKTTSSEGTAAEIVRGFRAINPDLTVDDDLLATLRRLFGAIADAELVSYHDSPLNWTGVGVFERLGDMLDEEGGRILAGLAGESESGGEDDSRSTGEDESSTDSDGNGDGDDDVLCFTEKLSALIVQGRAKPIHESPKKMIWGNANLVEKKEPNSPPSYGKGRKRGGLETDDIPMQTITGAPTDDCESDDHGKAPLRPEPYYWEDEQGIAWVNVEKKSSKYELVLYSHPSIQSSPYFPKFRSGNVDANGTLHLTVEAVLSQMHYVELYPKRWKSDKRKRLTLARIILDLMGALRTMHANGFVHSDVSSNNIGFNNETGIWQLFDFDRALPIEESLATPRIGGTRGCRSRYSEETGIFRVFDDYIAMMRACYTGFPLSFFAYDDILGIFADLIEKFSDFAKPEDVDLDQCYLEAFDIFCKEKSKTSSSSLLSDPTYLAAIPIQKSIINKMK